MEKRHSGTNCRRRSVRIPMPLEVQLATETGIVKAIVRDVSLDDDSPANMLGVGLFHKDSLPLQQQIHCTQLSKTSFLFKEFDVVLIWTRQFGCDGFISGGQLIQRTVEELKDVTCDLLN